MTPAPGRPRVIYATIYPPRPGRVETFVTRELLREYVAGERGFDLCAVIASAHRESPGEKMLREFPTVPAKLVFLETEHAGVRAEEISFCKERLPELLMAEEFDWLLFMDANVWTPIAQVPEWIGLSALALFFPTDPWGVPPGWYGLRLWRSGQAGVPASSESRSFLALPPH